MKRRITLTQSSLHDSHSTSGGDNVAGWSLINALELIVRKRRFLATVVMSTAVITAAIALLIPNTYMSSASILPSGQQDKMADLKSLAGLGGLMGNDENSSELFPIILTSQTIRDAVLSRRYSYRDDDVIETTTLTEYFDEDNPDKLRMALSNVTHSSTDKKTGVITVAVETEYPELSQAIVMAYIEELESFNLVKRKSKGKESAAYLETQVEAKRLEVEAAEDSLEEFQSVNRDWAMTGSPEVLKIVGRLQRELQVKTVAYGYLQQQYEMARLDAKKDVPIIRLLDPASLPVEKASPMRTLIILAVTLVSFMAAVFGLFISESWKRFSAESDDEDYKSLRRELDSAFPRLRKSRLHEMAEPTDIG